MVGHFTRLLAVTLQLLKLLKNTIKSWCEESLQTLAVIPMYYPVISSLLDTEGLLKLLGVHPHALNTLLLA